MPEFKGPGQWRSQAERPDDNVFMQMADMARRLADLGQPEAEALVHKAEKQAAAGDNAAASATLLEAASALGARSPAYADGLRGISGKLPAAAPRGPEADGESIPGMAP
jgi:hypothetical protein